MKFFSVFSLAAGLALGICPQLHASITYVCDSSITGDASQAPGGTCNFLNTTIAGLYGSTFSNANATIYIQLGTAGLGESQFQVSGVSYSSYVSQFTTQSTDAVAVSDVLALGGEPNVSGDVFLTAAQEQALDFNTAGQQLGVMSDGLTACTLGSAGCYNGVITIDISANLFYRNGGSIGAAQYDFFTIAEHETDEILGTASCITAVSGTGTVVPAYDGCGNGNGLAPTDLFRYTAPGTLAWLTSANTPGSRAYFSLDGGNTVIQYYHNTPDGGDYGDWAFQGGCPADYVQTWEAPAGCSVDITTDPGTPEIQLLNAVGFNLETVPEPATVGLLASGLAVLGAVRLRRRKRAA